MVEEEEAIKVVEEEGAGVGDLVCAIPSRRASAPGVLGVDSLMKEEEEVPHYHDIV